MLSEFPGGWWIVPDFAFKTQIRDLPPERIRLREAIAGVTQRQLDASAFEDRDDLAASLHRVGFDVQVCRLRRVTLVSTLDAGSPRW